MAEWSRTNNTFRLVMVGDESVGKSSLTLRLVKDDFKEYNPPTIGAAYLNQTISVGEHTVKLDLWDTAGQERFASLAPMYYRTAQAAVVTYDLCRRNTFSRAVEWLKELRTQAPPDTLILLCGNKVDKAELRQITREEGQRLASDKGIMFAEVSAKTGQGVKDAFYKIAESLVSQRKGDAIDGGNGQTSNIVLRQNKKTSGKCQC